MAKRNITTEIEPTYSKLKEVLLEKGCKIVSESPPKHIVVHHGSLRGITPRNAKKIIDYKIYSYDSGSKIVSQSSISSDWANLTLGGSAVAGVVAGLFWWIASDITNLLMNGNPGYWIWLAGAFGYPNIQYTFFMVDVTKVLSVVLVVTIIFEILDLFIVYRRISKFAEETLDELT